MPATTGAPTVEDFLAEATARLDALATRFSARWENVDYEAATHELWRTTAALAAAVRMLAERGAR